jgi:uncharacterized protein YcbK (DUF882 family)
VRISVLLFLPIFLFLVPAQPAVPQPTLPRVPPLIERSLRMFHIHTGEHIDIVYKRGDQYLEPAVDEINHFLRDWRTGDDAFYEPQVFDILADLAASLDVTDAELEIICGYRTPVTNQGLRANSTGVAKNSLHMLSQAIDVRVPGLKTAVYRDAALKLERGGVGYYPESNFVHVDSGRVRRW